MNEQEKLEFFDELSSLALADLLNRYADNPEERPYIEEFFLANYCKKPYIQYEESIRKIFSPTEGIGFQTKNARTCAIGIISKMLDFNNINSIQNVKDRVGHEIKVAEGFAKPTLPKGEWRNSENLTPDVSGLKEKINRVLKE